jgi:hypothetical protein
MGYEVWEWISKNQIAAVTENGERLIKEGEG